MGNREGVPLEEGRNDRTDRGREDCADRVVRRQVHDRALGRATRAQLDLVPEMDRSSCVQRQAAREAVRDRDLARRKVEGPRVPEPVGERRERGSDDGDAEGVSHDRRCVRPLDPRFQASGLRDQRGLRRGDARDARRKVARVLVLPCPPRRVEIVGDRLEQTRDERLELRVEREDGCGDRRDGQREPDKDERGAAPGADHARRAKREKPRPTHGRRGTVEGPSGLRWAIRPAADPACGHDLARRPFPRFERPVDRRMLTT